MMMRFAFVLLLAGLSAQAAPKTQELLIKLAPDANIESTSFYSRLNSSRIEKLSDQWVLIHAPRHLSLNSIMKDPAVEVAQNNYKIVLPEDYRIEDPLMRAAFAKMMARNPQLRPAPLADNPAIPDIPQQATGTDPLFDAQWALKDLGVERAWKVTQGSPDIIVAVLDTGIDYTHPDLLPNIWRNPKEIPNNEIDDDKNGFVDDVIGWDFVSNDNKPYDLTSYSADELFKSGNSGHGTHCAGTIAARADNAVGIAGVAPHVKIMPLRFISEKGQGRSSDVVKAIHYAVDNGAKIINASWVSEGEGAEGAHNQALHEAIQYALDKGVLFVTAAGNGSDNSGLDSDDSATSIYPASFDLANIISVTAIDAHDELAPSANWGAKKVQVGAPGVDILSTVVGGGYSNVVFEQFGFKATWDGTSTSTPFVSGAAALYWSAHPDKEWQDVKAAVLGSVKKINSLANKTTSGGKLDVDALLKY